MDPAGDWEPSTAEQYIDQQVATITGNLAGETVARQTADTNLQNQVDTLSAAVGTGGTVDQRIQAEATARANADTGLSNRITPLEQAVGSGGSIDTRISNAVSAEQSRAQSVEATKADKATTLAGYGITDAYTKTEVNDLVDTPHQNYVTVQTYSALPTTGSADTIYRVSNYDGSVPEVNVTKYSEYAWNGSQYVFLCVKSQIDEVFDITVYHSNTTYSDLAAALGTDGTNIPPTLRRGGMSVKYVQSSDNNYVKFFCMAQNFTTDVTQWQGMDDEPITGSKNLITSDGVAKELFNYTETNFAGTIGGVVFTDVNTEIQSSVRSASISYIPVRNGEKYLFTGNFTSGTYNNLLYVGFTNVLPEVGVQVTNIVKSSTSDAEIQYKVASDGYIVIGYSTYNWSNLKGYSISEKTDGVSGDIYVGDLKSLKIISTPLDSTDNYFIQKPKKRINKVNLIRFKARTGTVNFYKVTWDGFGTNATKQLITSIENSAAEDGTIKEISVDVTLNQNEYIGINGKVYFERQDSSIIDGFEEVYFSVSTDSPHDSHWIPVILAYEYLNKDSVEYDTKIKLPADIENVESDVKDTETELREDMSLNLTKNDSIQMSISGFINRTTGEINADTSGKYFVSNKIPVNVGDKFQYGLASYGSALYALYDVNDNPLDIGVYTNNTYIEGTYTITNSKSSYIRFAYRNDTIPSGKTAFAALIKTTELLKDYVVKSQALLNKKIFLFGDSISSSNYPWYKEYLEKYTGAIVYPMGDPGRGTGYLAKNIYFNRLATIDFDYCIALTGANDGGAANSVGTFSSDTELYAMGEPIVTEPSIDVEDYDSTGKTLIQSISYIIRKWKKLYWNFRLKANLNACILDGENNYEVVYPLSGTATEQECMDYAETQGWGDISYSEGRYFLRTTETPESKREKLMSVKHPKLYYCTTFPRRINTPEDWHSDPVRSERKRLAVIECCKKYGIPCIDLAREWAIQWDEEPCFYNPDNRPLSQVIVDNEGIYTMDGVHPNEFGYEWIARIVAKALNA